MRPTLVKVLLPSKARVSEGILIEQGSENKPKLPSKNNNSIKSIKYVTQTFLQTDRYADEWLT
jgi:hypothetical protein